ncbi:nucleoside/nucleotide kinase family protein [Saccharopolyspora rhizosphaerae]|uniref:Nucleoside/nucleotide kinase family protein n=1 Tax=Saccharopolyspora rhizosphaerae TaxID=2492662 RepID=A0A426JYX9_9PSEU|nr:nucleoside/nucleotide kinase family protein [Saccharopolyspora rhizosphaerae]RRO18272.1 nucleoside/nucleotide kinase family protein [Saccharopolyspora rhizosphaerae]
MTARHHGGLPDLIDRARALASTGERRILGIAGGPGSGKGTLAEKLLGELGSAAVVVPMDGFHLAEEELRRLGRRDRKGAPDTFDAAGYVVLLRRIRAGGETVYAPRFHREVEESFAGAIPVDPDVPLIITEGNYLLLDEGPWAQVQPLLDETWFLDHPDEELVSRLVERHVQHGKTAAEAEEWVRRSDMRNAARITPTRSRADLVIAES